MIFRPLKLLAAIAALVSIWAAASWYLSDEQKIHRRLQRIQKLVAKSPTESELAGLAVARSLAGMFAQPFSVTTEPVGYSTSDRGSLVSGIHQYRSRSSTLVMEISGEQIFLDAEGDGANSFFSARFLAGISDLQTAEQHDVRIHWLRHDGKWLINDVQVSGVHSAP
jgi:hypothetical protein